jgi:hypothetical protein
MSSIRIAKGPRSAALIITVLLGGALLDGCGSGADSGSSSAADAQSAVEPAPAAGGAPDGGEKSDGSTGSGGSTRQDAAALVDPQKLIRTATMSVQAKDITVAAQAVRRAVEQADGYISDEQTTIWHDPVAPPEPEPGPDGDQAVSSGPGSQSVLTARVPNAALDRVMLQVGATGTVQARSQSSKDVTTQYADVASRVATQKASVTRVRALLNQATSLGQVVQIEGELTRRQADLDSLEAQLKSLQGRTALSTLTVTLTPVGLPAAGAPKDDSGFLAGLRSGWSAFSASVTGLLTVLGATLPFLVLLALVGGPMLVWSRRRRVGRTATSTPAEVQPAP